MKNRKAIDSTVQRYMDSGVDHDAVKRAFSHFEKCRAILVQQFGSIADDPDDIPSVLFSAFEITGGFARK